MKTLLIPSDITTEDPSLEIHILDYNSYSNATKNRISLHKNLFCFLVEGQKGLIAPEKNALIDNTEILLLSSGNCLMTEKVSVNGLYKSSLLFFSDAVLIEFFLKHKDVFSAPHSPTMVVSEAFHLFGKDDFLHHFLQSLHILLQSGKPISKEMKRLKFEELMMYLFEKNPSSIYAFYLSRLADPQELEIRSAVESNIAGNVSVAELAFLCNMSLSTFKRRFQKIYGQAPNTWMLEQRMRMAANLLQYRNERPSEIFSKVGYENHSSFTHAFRQTYGKTPKEFQLQTLTQ